MSKDIENKVVSMEFDNSKFEKPAKESMSTLDKLKEALNFKGVEQGMDKINKAVKSVTFSPLEKGIDSVYAKFTMFERFTIQLYDRMANTIINMGTKLGREVFTVPVSSGKSEYELKMGSIQTIMASTGEELETVNKHLDELNKYSDDTIYNFSDMTNNIGKFTNAGVELDDSVLAIKGISNEAALAGANAKEASRAMYNFSQALSAGYVKLIDWKSIELANMATKSFKEELLNTAKEVGTVTEVSEGLYKTLKDHTVSATKDFNNTLSDAWLTSEVLIKTLQKYADPMTDIGKKAQKAATEVKTFSMMIDTLKEALQTGWADSWQFIFGDFNKARDLWTSLTGVLSSLIDRLNYTRNSMLKFWAEMGGRDAMLNSFKNTWKALSAVLGTIKKAFQEVIPPMTGKRLVQISRTIENLTARLRPSNETLLKVGKTFKGLFSIFGIGLDAVKALTSAMAPLFGKAFKFSATNILNASSSLGEWIINLRQSLQEGRVFEHFFGNLASVFAFFGKTFSTVFNFIVRVVKEFNANGFKAGMIAIKDGFIDLLKSIWKTIKGFDPLGAIKKLGVKMADTISEWPIGKAVINVVKAVYNGIANSPIWQACVSVVEGFINAIQRAINKLRGVDTSATEEFTDNVKKGFGPLEAIKNFFTAIWHGILAVWEVIGPAIKTIGKAIGLAFSWLFNGIKNVIDRSDLGDVGGLLAGGGLAYLGISLGAFIKNISDIVQRGSRAVGNFAKLIRQITGVLRSIEFAIYTKAIKEVAISIAILVGAIFLLSTIPADKVARATASIIMLFQSLASAMKTFSTISGGSIGAMASAGLQLMSLGVAISLMTVSLIVLSFLPYENMVKGLATLVLMLRAVTSEVNKLTTTQTNGLHTVAIMLALGALMNVIAVTLAAITGLVALSPGATALAATIMVALIGFIGLLLKEMNTIPAGTVSNPLKAAPLLAIFAGFWLIAGAIAKLALIAKITGPEEMAAATVAATAVAVALGGIVAALYHVLWKEIRGTTRKDISQKMLSIALVMVGFAMAVQIMATSIFLLGLLPIDKMTVAVKALAVMVGVIALMVIAVNDVNRVTSRGANTISRANGSIASLAKNLTFIGLGLMGLAAATLLIANAALVISQTDISSLNKAMAVLLAVFGLATILSYGAGKSSALASGLDVVGKALKGFAIATAIFSASIAIMVGALYLLSQITEQEAKQAANNLVTLSDAIIANGDKIANSIGAFIAMILASVFHAMSSTIGEFIKGTLDIFISAFDALIEKGPELIDKALTFILMILDGIRTRAPEITEKLVTTLVAVIDGLATAISEHSTEIAEAIGKAFDAIIDVVTKSLGRLFGLTGKELDIFADMIRNKAKFIVTFIGSVFAMSKMKALVAGIIGFGNRILKKIGDIVYIIKSNGPAILSVFKTVIGGIGTAIKGIGSFITANPYVAIAVAAIAAFTILAKIMESTLDTVDGTNKRASEIYDRVKAREQEYQDMIAKRDESINTVDKEAASTENYLDKLRGCVDSQGRLIKGKEEEFNFLKEHLNGQLQISLDTDTNRVSVIDEQNNQLDIQSQKVDEILKKKKLQDKLDAAAATAEEARSKLNSGELQNDLAKAKLEYENFRKEIFTIGNDTYTGDELMAMRDEWEHLNANRASFTQEEFERFQELNQTPLVDWFQSAGLDIGVSLRNEISSTEFILAGYQSTVDTFDEALSMAGDSVESLEAAIDRLNADVTTKKSGASAEYLIGQYSDIVRSIQDAKRAGVELPEELRKKYETELELLQNDISSYGEYGQRVLEGFGTYGKSNLVSAIEEGVQDAITAAEEGGSNIGKGLAKGVESERKTLHQFMSDIATDMIETYKKATDQHSPSKVFEKLGGYDMLGLINGVTKKEGLVNKAYDAMAIANMGAYAASMSKQTSGFAFSPLINSTGFQNGISSMQSQLSGLQTGALSTGLTAKLAASVNTSKLESDNSQMLRELQDMRREFGVLSEAVRNMQIVMDNGTLVGQIAPAMDQELGRRAVKQKRGV